MSKQKEKTKSNESPYPIPRLDSKASKLIYISLCTIEKPTREELCEKLDLKRLKVCKILDMLVSTPRVECYEDEDGKTIYRITKNENS